jgi:hypothetical protein
MKTFQCSFRPAHANGPIMAHATGAPPTSPLLLTCRPTGARLHRARAMLAVRSPPPSTHCDRATAPLSSSLSVHPYFFPIPSPWFKRRRALPPSPPVPVMSSWPGLGASRPPPSSPRCRPPAPSTGGPRPPPDLR